MRLIDIEVDEVSLVDKAANNKKFAFMKRDSATDNKDAENKEVEKKDEIKQSEEIIANIDEPTAEEIEQINDLLKQVNELNASLKN